MTIVYDIYSGDNAGGPVNYTTPVAAGVTGLSWTGTALPAPSTTRFAVRARDTVSGLSELNTDAVVTIPVSAAGADLGGLPAAPAHPRAVALAGGAARLEWAWPYRRGPRPAGFRIYGDAGTGTVDHATVLATVPYSGPGTDYRATLAGLAGGTTYLLAVRAYNAAGEEPNVLTAAVTAVATPPANPTGLTATATAVAGG
jgi:hypothetical protein